MRQFADRGVAVWSLGESWTETSDPHVRELITAIMAWVARMESQRRSERTRACLSAASPGRRTPGRASDQGTWPAGASADRAH